MRQHPLRRLVFSSVIALSGLGGYSASVYAQDGGAAPTEDDIIEQGRQLAFDRKKGNCLACHLIEGGTLPGNIGPPLIAMKARFPDKDKLRAQIADATKSNPHSIMPPFEKFGVMSPDEVYKVTEFIYTL